MWHLGLRKNPKLVVLVIIFVVLSIVATVLAVSYHFLPAGQTPSFYSSAAVYSGQ